MRFRKYAIGLMAAAGLVMGIGVASSPASAALAGGGSAHIAPEAASPPPAPVKPPKCIAQSQYDQPYEWAYTKTSRWKNINGHGWTRHHFLVYYAPADWWEVGTWVYCQINF